MKKHYTFVLFVFTMLCATQINAQTVVNIPASTDPTMPTDIFPVIMGDTTATGERNDNNTIYKLENGQVYITTGRIVNKPEWDLRIEAVDLSDTENKPIITRVPNASGTYPDIMRPEGNVTLRNIWFVVGERGALEQHDWGKIRYMGDSTRVIADHCIFEKDRGGFFQLRGNNIKLYVTNCILRNGGNRRILQGNGRGVDARNTTADTIIIKNTIVHNIQDRFFRSQGAMAPHNYVEIDHCTAFNVAGRHGFIQLGRVTNAKITNNLFINPIMLGSSPVYTDEQTQPDGDLHKVITLDTLYDNTTLTISNNNVFWTSDVTDYWASNDSVSAPDMLSTLVMDNLGAAASDAVFEEQLTLNSVPGSILQYVEDLYADPAADDMFDFIVEDDVVAGTAFDSGNLFDFDTFDPCYGGSTQSATASTDGGPIGAVAFCPDLTDVFDVDINEALALRIFPNPTSTDLNLTFELQEASQVNIAVMDMSGRVITTILQGQLQSGQHTLNQNISNRVARGMYFLSLQTDQGMMTKKFVVQ
ncbi:MAG: T9SS type A sorting domain-containing protein [Bacteroidota bacterium]